MSVGDIQTATTEKQYYDQLAESLMFLPRNRKAFNLIKRDGQYLVMDSDANGNLTSNFKIISGEEIYRAIVTSTAYSYLAPDFDDDAELALYQKAQAEGKNPPTAKDIRNSEAYKAIMHGANARDIAAVDPIVESTENGKATRVVSGYMAAKSTLKRNPLLGTPEEEVRWMAAQKNTSVRSLLSSDWFRKAISISPLPSQTMSDSRFPMANVDTNAPLIGPALTIKNDKGLPAQGPLQVDPNAPVVPKNTVNR